MSNRKPSAQDELRAEGSLFFAHLVNTIATPLLRIQPAGPSLPRLHHRYWERMEMADTTERAQLYPAFHPHPGVC